MDTFTETDTSITDTDTSITDTNMDTKMETHAKTVRIITDTNTITMTDTNTTTITTGKSIAFA